MTETPPSYDRGLVPVPVAVVMGSDSDYPVAEAALEVLDRLGVGYRVRVLSAHRSPDALQAFVRAAPAEGVRVFIALAGGAAHLAGAIAAATTLPVIGVPVDSSPLKGVDALHATVMMPGGIPVATMAVGRAGAQNAGVFAAQVLALSDPGLLERLRAYREEMAEGVARKDAELQERLAERRR